MAVLGEPSECRLDVLLARPPGKPQYVVVVALGHKLVFRSSLLRRGLSLTAASIEAKPSADHNPNDTLGSWLAEGWHSRSPPTRQCQADFFLSSFTSSKSASTTLSEAPFFFSAPPPASAPGAASPPPACCAP